MNIDKHVISQTTNIDKHVKLQVNDIFVALSKWFVEGHNAKLIILSMLEIFSASLINILQR